MNVSPGHTQQKGTDYKLKKTFFFFCKDDKPKPFALSHLKNAK